MAYYVKDPNGVLVAYLERLPAWMRPADEKQAAPERPEEPEKQAEGEAQAEAAKKAEAEAQTQPEQKAEGEAQPKKRQIPLYRWVRPMPKHEIETAFQAMFYDGDYPVKASKLSARQRAALRAFHEAMEVREPHRTEFPTPDPNAPKPPAPSKRGRPSMAQLRAIAAGRTPPGEKTAPPQPPEKEKPWPDEWRVRPTPVQMRRRRALMGEASRLAAAFGKPLIVDLPEGITRIGERAFQGLSYRSWPPRGALYRRAYRIGMIRLPQSCGSIGAHAFEDCRRLTLAVLPEGLTEIGPYAFRNCRRLSRIALPPGLKTLGEGAFCMCGSLKRMAVPRRVHALPARAFRGCGQLKVVSLPRKLKSIGDEAFADCGRLRYVYVPTGVKTIGRAAFARCASLQWVYLPPTVESIGHDAFRDAACGLKIVCRPGSYAETWAREHGARKRIRRFTDYE